MLLTLMLFVACGAFGVTPREAVNRFVDTPRIPRESVAVLVTELPTGKVLASYNTGKSLVPASIMKSITIASVSDVADVEKEIVTPVYIDGKISPDGTLHGNLIVEGMGDPSVNTKKWPASEDIVSEIINALHKEKISHIEGNVIIDESRFAGPAVPPSWGSGDLSMNYGTGSHAFNYSDNAAGKRSVKNPDVVFIRDLRQAMDKNGISFGGNHIEGGKRKVILRHKSAPLKEIMRSCMQRSDNMFAETLLRQYGKHSGLDGSTQSAADSEMEHWRIRRIPMEGVRIVDGSGLSRSNRVTADFMEGVLRMKRNDVEYVSYFPLVGQEGTVRSFLSGTPLDAYMAVKTGSMRGIQCYAGYKLDDDFAPTHCVVVIVNDFTCDRSYLRKAIAQMLLGIFPGEEGVERLEIKDEN